MLEKAVIKMQSSHTDRKVHQRHGNPEWLSQANELPNVPIEPNAEASE